jgi:flagellar hook-length control protein FliK
MKGGEKMEVTTNVVVNAPQSADIQNTKVANPSQPVKSDDKNAKKDNNDFHSILGKAQDKNKDDGQDKDKVKDKAITGKAKDDKQVSVDDVKPETGIANQVIAMINVASLPNMQILAEATVPETLTTPSVNVVAGKNTDFSKLLVATNAKESGQVSLTGTLEQLLPQNDSGKNANQVMLDLLNGKTAGTLSQTGAVDQKQTNTLLQAIDNTAQKSADIPVISNVSVVQAEIKAPVGTATIANAAKAAVNFVSGQNDTKLGSVNKPATADLGKTDKQTKEPTLFTVNQPLNVTVEEHSQAKPNTVIDAQIIDAAKPVDEVKSTEKNALTLNNSSLPELKGNLKQHDVQAPTQFSQLMLNSMDTTVSSAGTAAPVETTQQLAKYDIPGQIVEQARLIKTNEDTQMIIKLNPEHLGDLTLKVSIANGGAVTASFHSDNAQVRTMLENSLIQLKQELEAKGMKVDNVEVYAGLGDFMSNGQNNQANSQQQKSSLKNHSIDLADFNDTVEKVGSLEGNISEDSVDYRI